MFVSRYENDHYPVYFSPEAVMYNRLQGEAAICIIKLRLCPKAGGRIYVIGVYELQ